jgi:hypothetical protein
MSSRKLLGCLLTALGFDICIAGLVHLVLVAFLRLIYSLTSKASTSPLFDSCRVLAWAFLPAFGSPVPCTDAAAESDVSCDA